MAGDARLLKASLRGDHDAFARIVRRYQSLVCAITYSGTGDLSASEDLAQETFLTAWKRLDSLREPKRLRPWLCTIARNRTADWLRRRQRDPMARALPVEEAPSIESATPTPAERAVLKERERLVWEALHEIPETYRVPLVLYYREQQSVGRVARELELSRAAVKKRLMRGRGMLRDKVAALVEDTLSTTAPGSAFALAVVAGLAGTAAQKATGAGSTILGLTLAKAAVVGTLAAGVAVGAAVALRADAPGPEPAPVPALAPIAAPPIPPAPPAPRQAAIYADGVPKNVTALWETDIKSWLVMAAAVQGAIGYDLNITFTDRLLGDLRQTKEVDLGVPVREVDFGERKLLSVFRVTDVERYVASLPPQFRKDRQEGDLQVYTDTETRETLLVDAVGRWATHSADVEEGRALMQMVRAGEFPAERIFPDAAIGFVWRFPAMLEALRQTVGIRAGPGAGPAGSWAALIDAAGGLAAGQLDTAAFAIGLREDELLLKLQLQPVAGAALAKRLAAGRPGGLRLLKYVPADSVAVLDLQLPDLSGLLPSPDPVPLPVRALRLLGDEAALALGRSPTGSGQLLLAAKARDVKAVQTLADDLAGLVSARLASARPGQPFLPLRLNRSEVRHNGHAVKVWDFELTIPLDKGLQLAPAKTLRTLLGDDLKVYEFSIDDTFVLAFGDAMFEKVRQTLDGSLAGLETAARFEEALADMPALPNMICCLEAERLADWLVELASAIGGGRPELNDLQFEEGLPVVFAGHVIGKDVIEVPVHLPLGALRAVMQSYVDAAFQPAGPPPLPPLGPSQHLPPAGLHGAASAGDKPEVERQLAGGADVNARGPYGRAPLHYAAEQGRLEVVQLLLEKGADANAEDDRRCTPLHLAAHGSHREVAEALLNAGAEVNATDLDGWTPTGYAVRAGHRDLAALLAEHGGVE